MINYRKNWILTLSAVDNILFTVQKEIEFFVLLNYKARILGIDGVKRISKKEIIHREPETASWAKRCLFS